MRQTKRSLAILNVSIAVVLFFIKYYAFVITNSRAILSDSLESIVNVVASSITLVVIFIALKPADDDHPYGHGKAESLASTFEGGAILFAGIWIIVESVNSFWRGHSLQALEQGLALVVGAGLVNAILGVFLLKKGKSLDSLSLISGGQHLITDALTSLGSIVALILVKVTGVVFLDPVIAIVLGVFFIYNGIKILRLSFDVLLDAQSDPYIDKLAELFNKYYDPGLIDIHFTRIMRAGDYHHIDMHVAVPEFWSVEDCYKKANTLEKNVLKEYPVKGEFHFILEPCGQRFCESCEVSDCSIRKKEFLAREKYTRSNLTPDIEYSP